MMKKLYMNKNGKRDRIEKNNIGYYISGSSGGKLTCTAYTYK